jgi:ectoine hydroxylase-related dioxygenase (phytanoyl-CoA dioxygenase family)
MIMLPWVKRPPIDSIPEMIVARYREDGFAVIRKVCGSATVSHLRSAYTELLVGAVGSSSYNLMGGKIPQIGRPSLLHSAFKANEAIEEGAAQAALLMGVPRAMMCFDMLIYKEPGNEVATPWHQDHAYSEGGAPPKNPMPHPLSTVQMWIALDDVDAQNGCMHFIPRCHLGPTLEHEWTPDGSMLRIKDEQTAIDLSAAVSCPLRAGDATAHGPNTPHFTPGNKSPTRPRRAYIITFAPSLNN